MSHSDRFRLDALAACLLAIGHLISASAALAQPAPDTARSTVDLPRFPSISPDGSTIVFSWRGDLWKLTLNKGAGTPLGGHAVRLTSHPGDDLRSAWSFDGAQIAFESDRDGFSNLYMMNADGTAVTQVTRQDQRCVLAEFGLDAQGGPVLTFDSNTEADTYRSNRPYMVSLQGGDLLRVHNAFGSHPVISRDGTRVLFSRGAYFNGWDRRHYLGPESQDVWLYTRADNSFRQITRWPGNDGFAHWAGDQGNDILFLSDRELDCVNLYRLDLQQPDAAATRLTSFTEADIHHLDVSDADGSRAVFAVWDSLYVLDLKTPGAQPIKLAVTAFEDESDNYQIKSIDREASEAALSPDGKVMAYIAYGEVYIRNLEDKSPTQRITDTHARERDIAWSPDGLKLYFSSDSPGNDSIYEAVVTLTRKEVKDTFEKTLNPPPPPAEVPVAETPATPTPDPNAAQPDPSEPQPPQQPEPDPKLDPKPEPTPPVEPPAAQPEPTPPPITEPGAAPAATQEPPAEPPAATPTENDSAKPDDQAKDKSKAKKKDVPKELDPKRWQDAIKFAINPVVDGPETDRVPSPSPDGKHLAFRRGNGDLMLKDLKSGEIRRLAAGWDTGLHWRWSPDGKHIAYVQSDMDFNSDIFIVPVDGSALPVNITRHPDNDESPRWSADGRILSFISERVNEEYDVWMVYLDRNLESYTPRELEQYYKDAADAAKKRKPLAIEGGPEPEVPDAPAGGKKGNGEKKKPENGAGGGDAEEKKDDSDKEDSDKPKDDTPPKPVEWSLADAYLRLKRITSLAGNEGNLEMTPAGDRLIFSAGIAGTEELSSIKWDGTERKRIAGAVSVQHLNLGGDQIVHLAGGAAGVVPVGGGEAKSYPISYTVRIDLQEQSSQKFLEAARTLGEQFYHPTMKDLDWPALTARYHSLARQARTAGEFNFVANRFLGELNGSHLAIRATDPPSPNRQDAGRLGTVHQRVEGGFKVIQVLPEGPAADGPMALVPGDIITALDLHPIGPLDTIESMLIGRVGVETIVSIRRTRPDGTTVDLQTLITPTSAGRERRLKYEAWRRNTVALVDQWSEGRLGYIHIEGMDQGSLDDFERDLYAAAGNKQGLIIDVRNNGGGWTADRLLSSIMVQPHAYTVPRGGDAADVGHYPQDRLFIQRYALPINMLCNEKSFSNAEIIAHAFKTLKRGTLVGQQTYGGVISTGGFSLIDGTFVRLPFRGWFLNDGTDMENNGALPDLLVPQTPEAESRDDDEQLRAAVEDLLKRLK